MPLINFLNIIECVSHKVVMSITNQNFFSKILHIQLTNIHSQLQELTHTKRILKICMALDSVAQLVGTSSCRPKRHRFDSWSGHTPRLWFHTLLGACARRQPINLSLLLASPLSKSKGEMSWGEDKTFTLNLYENNYYNLLNYEKLYTCFRYKSVLKELKQITIFSIEFFHFLRN